MAAKKLKGRPAMNSGKRTRKIDARFTEEEYRLVLVMERTLGVSRAELVRSRLLHGAGNAVVNAKELIRELDLVGASMGRVGNNINQLARYANWLRNQGAISEPVVKNYLDLLEKYSADQKLLEVTLRRIIRLMGR